MEARELSRHFRIPARPLARGLRLDRDRVVRAVDGVSLTIRRGETVGLVGESGCGKSTLGRTLLGLHHPTSGSVRFEGRDLSSLRGADLRAFRRAAQIIFQNPFASLNPRKTVAQMLAVALARRGVRDAATRDREIATLLEQVGLSPRHARQYPHQFSGGQRQRLAIARALAVRPRFVVADEPVASLDVSVQAQVLELMQRLQQRRDLTYLFIAHDLSVVYYVSDRVAVMYLGEVVEVAERRPLFEEPLHPYTQALLSAVPDVHRGRRRERILLRGSPPSPIDPPAGCRFHTRCFAKIGGVCEKVRPRLREVAPGRFVACHLYAEPEEPPGPV